MITGLVLIFGSCVPAFVIRYLILSRPLTWGTAVLVVLLVFGVSLWVVTQLFQVQETTWLSAAAAISLFILTKKPKLKSKKETPNAS